MNHFAHEEQILQEHAQLHQTLVMQANKLRHPVNQETGVSVGELVDFLATEVVSRHMLNEDRKFAQLFSHVDVSVRAEAELEI